jgi:hypothetical protein
VTLGGKKKIYFGMSMEHANTSIKISEIKVTDK